MSSHRKILGPVNGIIVRDFPAPDLAMRKTLNGIPSLSPAVQKTVSKISWIKSIAISTPENILQWWVAVKPFFTPLGATGGPHVGIGPILDRCSVCQFLHPAPPKPSPTGVLHVVKKPLASGFWISFIEWRRGTKCTKNFCGSHSGGQSLSCFAQRLAEF